MAWTKTETMKLSSTIVYKNWYTASQLYTHPPFHKRNIVHKHHGIVSSVYKRVGSAHICELYNNTLVEETTGFRG